MEERRLGAGPRTMTVHLVNPSHLSLGVGVITPRWLFVLAGVWPAVLDDAAHGTVKPLYEAGCVDADRFVAAGWDLLPQGRYMWGSVQTVRGCPKHCSFCSVWRTDGQKPRQRLLHRLRDRSRASRRVQVLGSTPHPDEAFMSQVGRNLDLVDEQSRRVLICDRDAKWTELVHEQLREAGVQTVRTPYQALNANAHVERCVRSIKQECLNRIVPLGERHFRRTVAEYVHRERNHQSLAN
jgi:hypothetical protein